MACGLVGAAMMVPIAAAPIVGGIAATYLAAAKKVKETGDESFLKEDVTRYLQEEIERRNQSINQKLHTIEQIQREIANDQQQITECNFVLGQLESEEERSAIRSRLAEMNAQRYKTDTENKEFYEKQQESHRNHNLKILTSVAVITGLAYKFRKPLMNAGKALITKV